MKARWLKKNTENSIYLLIGSNHKIIQVHSNLYHMFTIFRVFISSSEGRCQCFFFVCVVFFFCIYVYYTHLIASHIKRMFLLNFIIKSQKFYFPCPSWLLEINLFKQKQYKTIKCPEKLPLSLWSWKGWMCFSRQHWK